MAAQVWIGLEQRSERLRRLEVVFAVELRLKIVTELFMREMSPREFHEEFGGGSLSRVTRNFERLEETGSLRYVRSEGPGGKRRGGKEHFYRATELAIFDRETWSMLPYSARAAFSWTILKQMGERWRDAVAYGSFDSLSSRRAGYTTLLVDREGWDRLRKAQDTLFVSLFEEQEDARLRLVHTGEAPMLATVALLGFESAMSDDSEYVGPELASVRHEPDTPFPPRLSKVLASDLCLQVLTAANRESISAKSFCAAYGGNEKAVRDRIALLVTHGWLKQVGEKTGGRRRGAVEKFYRATAPAFGAGDPWKTPASVAKSPGWKTFEEIAEVATAAMRAGTFDARIDRHHSWSLLRLDRQGWEKVTAAMEAFRSLVFEEQRLAKVRLEKSGERPICMTVAEAAFEASAKMHLEP